MRRVPGWEARLAGVLDAAAERPYVLGSYDCLRVACEVVAALTGVDHWQRFAGRYASRREALREIRAFGDSFGEAVSAVLQIDPTDKLLARRGDLVLYRDEAGDHIGICVGERVFVTGPEGLVTVPVVDRRVLAAWAIG